MKINFFQKIQELTAKYGPCQKKLLDKKHPIAQDSNLLYVAKFNNNAHCDFYVLLSETKQEFRAQARKGRHSWPDSPDSSTPAVTYFFEDGSIASLYYLEKGTEHRPSEIGPAVIKFQKTRFSQLPLLLSEEYYEGGKRHRLSTQGPAHIEYNVMGKVSSETYFENGISLSKSAVAEIEKLRRKIAQGAI